MWIVRTEIWIWIYTRDLDSIYVGKGDPWVPMCHGPEWLIQGCCDFRFCDVMVWQGCISWFFLCRVRLLGSCIIWWTSWGVLLVIHLFRICSYGPSYGMMLSGFTLELGERHCLLLGPLSGRYIGIEVISDSPSSPAWERLRNSLRFETKSAPK